MKRLLSFSFYFLLFSFLVSCDKDDTSATTDTVPGRNIPTGNIPTPGWAVGPDYDYSSSMTAVVAVDLMAAYPALTPADWQVDSADLLAAFAGGECVGVTAPITLPLDKGESPQGEGVSSLFFLYVVAPSQGGADIRLWYYSARLRNVFEGDTVLHFENGARRGTVAEPLRIKPVAHSR